MRSYDLLAPLVPAPLLLAVGEPLAVALNPPLGVPLPDAAAEGE
jgi:hypothetical protein